MNRDFLEMIRAEASPLFEGLVSALTNEPAAVAVRLNPEKNRPIALNTFAGVAPCGKVPWENEGYYLPERPQFTLDPALHQGRYYVQDASSMIIGEIARRIVPMLDKEDIKVLDSCAAPGGKTTSLISNLPETSLIVANEFDFKRAEVLAENIYKWGRPNVITSRGDTVRFRRLNNLFDIVLADVPCSGEGMFRKEPVAKEQWSKALVERCASRQREILDNIAGSIAPGGFLIYSTCTFNTVENEKNVEYLVRNYNLTPIEINLPPEWNIAGGINCDFPCYRFLPSRLQGEGLFVCVLKKEGASNEKRTVLPGRRKTRNKAPFPDICSQWFILPDIFTEGETVWGATPGLRELGELIDAKARQITGCGTPLATIKGKDTIPTQQLALSTALGAEAFPRVEVPLSDAIKYLRKETPDLPQSTPRGYILLTYGGYPLGFVKNIGNRSNNLYPAEWRIRHLGNV